MTSNPTIQADEGLDARRIVLKRFLRDVGINVLANLIAGLMIYIGGALAGLFPDNPGALRWAVVSLLSIASGGFMVAAFIFHDRQRGTLAYLLSVTALGAFLIIGGFWLGPPSDGLHWMVLILGSLLLLFAVIDLVRAARRWWTGQSSE